MQRSHASGEDGWKDRELTGLTGIGDLIVTCASVHSRNRKAGYLIGQGRTMQQAMDEVQMVVEGVYSTKAAVKLAQKYEVQMPIIEQVNAVLFEGKSAAEAVKRTDAPGWKDRTFGSAVGSIRYLNIEREKGFQTVFSQQWNPE